MMGAEATNGATHWHHDSVSYHHLATHRQDGYDTPFLQCLLPPLQQKQAATSLQDLVKVRWAAPITSVEWSEAKARPIHTRSDAPHPEVCLR